jgi:tetratricopeptide (TPR) repeat protein
VDQTTPESAAQDAGDIELRLVDLAGDAMGGKGSVTFISGGSVDRRRSIIARVLMETEEMGCLTVICDCRRPLSGNEPLAEALLALRKVIEGGAAAYPPVPPEGVWPSDRSYRAEMEGLDLLRSITENSTTVVVIEEMGAADLDTMAMFQFLARNIGRMGAMMVVTHSRMDEDQIAMKMLDELRDEVAVQELHLPVTADDMKDRGASAGHAAPAERAANRTACQRPEATSLIENHIRSSRAAMATGDISGSINYAYAALSDSMSIEHFGFVLDSYTLLGESLTQAGKEKEAFDILDKAIDLSTVIGELPSQRNAHLRKAELLLFSIGEPDSALKEAIMADRIASRSSSELDRIEPLGMVAIIEARNGRRDRAEKAFCDASGTLDGQPLDTFIKERMLLALAASLLLEARNDMVGMNARYGEAEVLATATSSPTYWSAAMSLQHGRSLLRLRRPREAIRNLDESARLFERLGNPLQCARVKRAIEGSELGPMPD